MPGHSSDTYIAYYENTKQMTYMLSYSLLPVRELAGAPSDNKAEKAFMEEPLYYLKYPRQACLGLVGGSSIMLH